MVVRVNAGAYEPFVCLFLVVGGILNHGRKHECMREGETRERRKSLYMLHKSVTHTHAPRTK